LGGIYGLERISTESKKDYWPIMEILTAYVRKNSPVQTGNVISKDIENQNKVSLDIQTILTVIGRRKYSYFNGEPTYLDLQKTCLKEAIFREPNLKYAILISANLKRAFLDGANLEGAILCGANLEGADLKGANLRGADLKGAILCGAILCGANLKGAKDLTIEQLSKVRTLYKTKLDEELEESFQDKDPERYKQLTTKQNSDFLEVIC